MDCFNQLMKCTVAQSRSYHAFTATKSYAN